MFKSLSLAALVAVASLLNACKSTTEPNSAMTAFTQPGVGSSFAMYGWNFDSSGRMYNQDTLKWQIIATHIAYKGKPDVMQLREFSPSDTTMFDDYVSFETNGNISEYQGDQGWLELPVATQTETVRTTSDTVGSDLYKNEYRYTYAGSDNLPLAGRTFTAVKMDFRQREWHNDTLTTDHTLHVWFAPETGWIVKMYEPTYVNHYGDTLRGTNAELVGYQFK